MYDRAGSFGLNFTQAALSYSYEARLNRKQAIRGGMRVGYTMRSFDPGNMLLQTASSATMLPPPLSPP